MFMSIKILVIDDDTDVKESTQITLMDLGYDVMLGVSSGLLGTNL